MVRGETCIWSALTSCIVPQLGLLNAIQNIGCLAAYPFSPYVADWYGRRTSVVTGAFIMCAATILQTASHSVGMFIGARYVRLPSVGVCL